MPVSGSMKANHNGVWKTIVEGWINNNGTWERFLADIPSIDNISPAPYTLENISMNSTRSFTVSGATDTQNGSNLTYSIANISNSNLTVSPSSYTGSSATFVFSVGLMSDDANNVTFNVVVTDSAGNQVSTGNYAVTLKATTFLDVECVIGGSVVTPTQHPTIANEQYVIYNGAGTVEVKTISTDGNGIEYLVVGGGGNDASYYGGAGANCYNATYVPTVASSATSVLVGAANGGVSSIFGVSSGTVGISNAFYSNGGSYSQARGGGAGMGGNGVRGTSSASYGYVNKWGYYSGRWQWKSVRGWIYYYYGGRGGSGKAYNITGTNVTYSGGGGRYGPNGNGSHGSGSGANLGGGANYGGTGNSGRIIIKWKYKE